MAEEANIFQRPQIGIETVAGTTVAANKVLQATSIKPQINPEFQTFRPQGYKLPTVVVPGKEWTTAKIEGAVSYTEEPYLLQSLIKTVASVVNGTGNDWIYDSNTSDSDAVKTLTVEVGSSQRAGKFGYGLVTGLTYKFDRSGVSKSGEMIGQLYTDDVSLTASPTAVALVPVVPTQVDVYLAYSAAGLGAATALNRALSTEIGITGRFGPVWALRSTQPSFAAHVELEPKITAKLTMAADDEGMTFLSNMRGGTQQFLRVKCTGPSLGGPTTNLLQFDVALKVSGVSEFKDKDGVYAIEWTFTGTHDATWGKGYQIKATNSLATL